MEHQPFENWIIDEIELSRSQAEELAAHLAVCERCSRLKGSLAESISQIRIAGMASPAPGFSLRWKESLAERRLLQQKLQTRRLLLFLLSGAVIMFFSLIGYSLATTSPVTLLVAGFEAVTTFFIRWDNFQQVIVSLTNSVPPYIPIAIWVLLASGIGMLTLLWAISLWRISTQGVQVK